jgi:hypothetical protein
MSVEQSVEPELAGKTKLLGGNLPRHILPNTDPIWPSPVLEPRQPRQEASD